MSDCGSRWWMSWGGTWGLWHYSRYVCADVCVCICLHMCWCVCVYACTCVQPNTCIYTHVHTCMYAHMHTQMSNFLLVFLSFHFCFLILVHLVLFYLALIVLCVSFSGSYTERAVVNPWTGWHGMSARTSQNQQSAHHGHLRIQR